MNFFCFKKISLNGKGGERLSGWWLFENKNRFQLLCVILVSHTHTHTSLIKWTEFLSQYCCGPACTSMGLSPCPRSAGPSSLLVMRGFVWRRVSIIYLLRSLCFNWNMNRESLWKECCLTEYPAEQKPPEPPWRTKGGSRGLLSRVNEMTKCTHFLCGCKQQPLCFRWLSASVSSRAATLSLPLPCSSPRPPDRAGHCGRAWYIYRVDPVVPTGHKSDLLATSTPP